MMSWVKVLGALTCWGVSLVSAAQPNRSPEAYGDPAKGQFGDPAQGYFGDASRGEFRRYNFSRVQEGTVPVLEGRPVERFQEVPVPPARSATATAPRRDPPAGAPYLTLDRPLDKAD